MALTSEEAKRFISALLQACLNVVQQTELTGLGDSDTLVFTQPTIDFLPIGRDMNAGVYRVLSEKGASYLLKVKSGEFYAASCIVPRYLSDEGIESVVAALRTTTNGLWARAGEWTVLVYPYLEG